MIFKKPFEKLKKYVNLSKICSTFPVSSLAATIIVQLNGESKAAHFLIYVYQKHLNAMDLTHCSSKYGFLMGRRDNKVLVFSFGHELAISISHQLTCQQM